MDPQAAKMEQMFKEIEERRKATAEALARLPGKIPIAVR